MEPWGRLSLFYTTERPKKLINFIPTKNKFFTYFRIKELDATIDRVDIIFIPNSNGTF